MISKPAKTIPAIVICEKCADTGIIFAHNKYEWASAPYAFRCECPLGLSKSTSLQQMPVSSKWVPEWIDKRPSSQWFQEKFMHPEKLDYDDEWKRRKSIWGNEWFKSKWEEHKAEIDKLNKLTELKQEATQEL